MGAGSVVEQFLEVGSGNCCWLSTVFENSIRTALSQCSLCSAVQHCLTKIMSTAMYAKNTFNRKSITEPKSVLWVYIPSLRYPFQASGSVRILIYIC